MSKGLVQSKSGRNKNTIRRKNLRPNHFLGYEHDRFGMYMMSCKTYDVAEAHFRRAIWLNQFDPCFKIHLAWCLYKEKKYTEARKWLSEIPENNMTSTMQSVKRLIVPDTSGTAINNKKTSAKL